MEIHNPFSSWIIRREIKKREDRRTQRQAAIEWQKDEEKRKRLRVRVLRASAAPKALEDFAKSLGQVVVDAGESQYVLLKNRHERMITHMEKGTLRVDGYVYKVVEIAGIENRSVRVGNTILNWKQAKEEATVSAAIKEAQRNPNIIVSKYLRTRVG